MGSVSAGASKVALIRCLNIVFFSRIMNYENFAQVLFSLGFSLKSEDVTIV